MSTRYEICPSTLLPGARSALAQDDQFYFFHRRSGNGEITSSGQRYTRHEDAVRAVRTDVEDLAEMLGISPQAFHYLYAPDLTYFDLVGTEGEGDPVYEERPLYPPDDAGDRAAAAADPPAGDDAGEPAPKVSKTTSGVVVH